VRFDYRIPISRNRVEPTRLTQFAIYDGRDRVGSFRQDDDGRFIVFDRRGRPLGVFDTRQAALAAIDAGVTP
jgi:hypothetical protein